MEMPNWPTRLLIDGALVSGEGDWLAAHSPSTEQELAQVRAASIDQVGAATGAARQAFETTDWAHDPAMRQAALYRLADLLDRHSDALTASIVHDVGAPISAARSLQLGWATEMIRWNAAAATRDRTIRLEPTPEPNPSGSAIYRVPAGVVAAITPYNYPLFMAGAKLGAALAAGCTTVLTPSPQTMLSTLMLAELVVAAGFPKGVLNIIVGGADVARSLTESPEVDRVSFTGSTPVGRLVMRQAADGLRGVVLELGGKAASIVMPDADLEAMVSSLHYRYMRNAGQACQAPTRLLVHESMFDRFIALSREVYSSVPVGDPWDENTYMGPLISASHRDRVEEFVASAERDGGSVVAGGGRPPMPRGWYVNPTLVAGVSNSARICQQEIFGPVAVVLPYADLDDAVRIANDTEMGLAGSVWGQDRDACLSVARRIRAGTVTINGGGPLRQDAPICGWKQSGVGREFGEDGIDAFLETQHVQWAL